MSGRILIIDAVATNRIILKVKLLSAQYNVTAVASQLQAEAAMAHERPDLILVDLSDKSEDRHAFCRDLTNNLQTSDIAILGTGSDDTARARLAALDAGVKDVLAHPIDESFLLARIRSLLRIKNAHSEIWVRDTAGRALGFEEQKSPFYAAPKVMLLTGSTAIYSVSIRHLARIYAPNAHILAADRHVPLGDPDTSPDLFVIDATSMNDPYDELFRLSADLRSRTQTRLATQLVIAPRNDHVFAAAALDLGADDVMLADGSLDELEHRCQTLIAQKRKQDKFHNTVKNGLIAAITDPLTGLYNRRYATPYLTGLAEKSQRTGQEFAVMMIDIDHFKTVNDTYGHAVGDAILVELSQRLRDNLRAIDLIARVGGEEFLVALPQSSRDMAEMTADRLRSVVNDTPFQVLVDRAPLCVTISIGVAIGRAHDDCEACTSEVCNQADTALYAAKSAGRNQVYFAASAA